MENNLLIDTSVLVNLQRKHPSTVIQYANLSFKSVSISRITACELIFGSRNKQEKKENKRIFFHIPVLEITPFISQLAFQIIDKYGLKIQIATPDALIAATALEYKIPLWTINTKHFSPIKELKLFSPVPVKNRRT